MQIPRYASALNSDAITAKSLIRNTVAKSADGKFGSVLEAAASTTESAPKSAGKIDFTNITPKELRETVNDLIKNGKMTLDESGSLLLLMMRDISPVNQGTEESKNQPMNVMAILRDGISDALSRNDQRTAYYAQLSIDALQRSQ